MQSHIVHLFQMMGVIGQLAAYFGQLGINKSLVVKVKAR